ncbi:MAG: alpha/beta hydrolase [Actinomycetota bacterium]
MIDTAETELDAVVCLHSLFLSPQMFNDLIAAGAGRYRFIAPEFLGQVSRLEDTSSPVVTMEEAAEDLWRIIEDLAVERFSIVAQSMGGDVAVRMAAQHPQRVRRIVLMGTSACAEPTDQRAAFTGLVDEVMDNGFTDDKVELLMSILFGASSRESQAAAARLGLWRRHISSLSPRLGPAMRGVVERHSAVGQLRSITAPTLIVSGAEDTARPPAWSDELFDHIPNAELWRLKRAGHSPLIEQPDIVNKVTLEFLDRPIAHA